MRNICSCYSIINNGNQRRYDPTRTLTLRNAFSQKMSLQFRRFKAIIRKSIMDEDCFGLKQDNILTQVELTTRGRGAFNFPRSQDKVAAFMDWLRTQEQAGLLKTRNLTQIGVAAETAWTDKYIYDSYSRGVARARYEMNKAGYGIPSLESTGGIFASMSTPFHMDRVGLLYTRTFSDLQGITTAMDTQISRVLSQGIADGNNPNLIAKKLLATVSGPVGDLGITDTLGRFIPAETRAKMLARTEIIRAHHQATIQEYENWGAEGVSVEVEFVDSGYNVCRTCSELNGRTFSLEEIRNIIPVHPNCKCCAIPIKKESGKSKDVKRISGRQGRQGSQGSQEAKTLMGSANSMAPCISTISSYSQIIIYKPLQTCTDYYQSGGKWLHRGKEIPQEEIERIKKLGIPPAWTNVIVASDRTLKVQAIGMDTAGRWQYRYSAEHITEQAAKKFKRSRMFENDIDSIRRKAEADLKKGDARAYLLRLEDKTGIRAGSLTDFKAKKKAYGLTTLQNEHVKISGNKITLEFIAKEGISQQYVLFDAEIAPWLSERKAATQIGERLFSDVSAERLNTYIKELAGKKYTIKDFRTLHGTRVAREALEKYLGKTYTKTEKKKIIQEVSTKASQFLHNTPTMALKSYIDPIVWEVIGGLP